VGKAEEGGGRAVERELGGGGMSRVFVAHEHRLSRRVVVKVLSPELVQGLNAERFEREILLAASLQQANIVPVLTAGEVGGLPYFTMPFIEGESLRSRLTGTGLPISDVLAILRDVTKALAYAHSRGIVHRDIKPDNVLLSGGTAVVTDFGIAKALSASRTTGVGATLTSVGTSIGTPAYMAPEQVAGDPGVDHRADLYSLGCLAQELITGRPPFSDRTAQRMLAAHLSEAPPSIESARGDCPPALARLVSQLLAKDPADRPRDANAVLRALDAASTASAPNFVVSGPGMLPKVLAIYAAATGLVALVTRAAVVGIGLPEWAFTGAMLVMLLGLPVLLFTAWVKRTVRRAASTVPTLTPGGTMVASHGTMATLALKANRYISWRRTMRGGMLAMGGFALLVTGFMVTRAMGIGPAASLFASGALDQQDRVLLADLVAAPEDTALASIVVEAVRAAMSQTSAIKLIEPADLTSTLEQMRRELTARIGPDIAHEVALRSGAKAILGGRFARAGSGYAVSLELVSTDSGAVLASVQGTSSEADLIGSVDKLTRRLRGNLGESLRRVQQSVPLARATTTSLAALRKFTEASRANDVEGDFDAAVRAAREAVALDSTFALAWRKLAIALLNGKYPVAARDSALEQSMKYADRLSPLERQLVIGTFYAQHSSRSDSDRALEAFKAAYRIDPTNSIALQQVKSDYAWREVHDSALMLARQIYRLAPNIRNRLFLVDQQRLAGHHDEAVALLDSIRLENPADTAIGIFQRIEMALALQSGDAEAALKWSRLASESPQLADRVAGLEVLANLELTMGHLAESQQALVTRSRLMASRDRFDDSPIWEADKNIRFRGEKALGVRQLNALIASPAWTGVAARERNYWDVIDIYSEAGRPDLARQVLDAWRRDVPESFDDPWWRSYILAAEGAIAAAEGNHQVAAEKYRAAIHNPDGSVAGYIGLNLLGLGRAYDAAGQVDSAEAVYRRFLALPGDDRHQGSAEGNGLALIYKRLGEMAEARGDSTPPSSTSGPRRIPNSSQRSTRSAPGSPSCSRGKDPRLAA
ncbi:MAG TPA: serine/threonine-protein kinase, partial [Gemmatimonadales bacterium]|nr:serine/threonine-protein kinase [Gemmatimonadales bacterium]